MILQNIIKDKSEAAKIHLNKFKQVLMNTLRKKRSLGIGVTLSNKNRRCKAKIALLYYQYAVMT